MRRYSVHSRILFGVAAWLLGAATATTGSLLAVSLLGQGITGNSAQLLTQDAVNSALASEAAQGSPSATPSGTVAGLPSPAPATPSPAATSGSPVPSPVATTASPPAFRSSPASTPPPPTSGGAVLTSAGGDVVAACQGADAYLISWTPRQGYQVGDVIRGPALTARVTFASRANRVTMTVSCSAGVPSATSHTGIDE